MRKICCVCRKELGDVPGPPDRLTHGFCERCYRDELRAWEARFGASESDTATPTRPAAKPRSD